MCLKIRYRAHSVEEKILKQYIASITMFRVMTAELWDIMEKPEKTQFASGIGGKDDRNINKVLLHNSHSYRYARSHINHCPCGNIIN